MNKEELEAFAREAVKTLKTEQDINDFRAILEKRGLVIMRPRLLFIGYDLPWRNKH